MEAVVKAGRRQRAGAWTILFLVVVILIHMAMGAVLGGVCRQSIKGEL